MNKHNTQKDILYISISVFVVVFIWVGFNIFHTYVTTTIKPNLQIQIEPIDSSFDLEAINSLKTRRQVNPVYEIDAPSSSKSAETTPSNQGSQSASLVPSTPTQAFSLPGQ